MKKIFAIILALVIFCSVLAGCNTKQTDKTPNVLTIGVDANYPPLTYTDSNGNYTGFDVELARQVAKNLNTDIEFISIDWGQKSQLLENGDIDCVWSGFSITAQRQNAYTWTTPYMTNNQVVVVAKDSNIKNRSDLRGATVTASAQKESSSLDIINLNDRVFAKVTEVVEAETQQQALDNVISGKADAAVVDETAARYIIEKENANCRILDEVVGAEQVGIGFKLGNKDLKDKVEHALKAICDDGTMKNISMDYFGKDVTTFSESE